MRINWSDKAQNLREIASELNIGIDSLAFLDDNPVEREQVRAALPEVTVIELPEDPLEYAATLRECPVFERLTLSAEDQQRTAFYAEQRERSEAEQQFPVEGRLLPFSRTRSGDCAGDAGHPGANLAAHAEDQPVQPDDPALHRAANRRHGGPTGVASQFDSRA